MRIHVLSDLHVEHSAFDPPRLDEPPDCVVLAGDIHNGVRAVRWARSAFPDVPVVLVAGNHEFYDHDYGEALRAIRSEASELGIHFLENDAIEIDGVRFLGGTLWTDFALFDRPAQNLPEGACAPLDVAGAMRANLGLLADFRAIRWQDPQGARRFLPSDAVALHAVTRQWLESTLGEDDGRPTVVVTHHLPSWGSVHPDFLASVTNAGFASDLDTLVARADLWIHGHTHCSRDYTLGAARVVCNPRGYPRRSGGFENRFFDPCRVVELPKRSASRS